METILQFSRFSSYSGAWLLSLAMEVMWCFHISSFLAIMFFIIYHQTWQTWLNIHWQCFWIFPLTYILQHFTCLKNLCLLSLLLFVGYPCILEQMLWVFSKINVLICYQSIYKMLLKHIRNIRRIQDFFKGAKGFISWLIVTIYCCLYDRHNLKK